MESSVGTDVGWFSRAHRGACAALAVARYQFLSVAAGGLVELCRLAAGRSRAAARSRTARRSLHFAVHPLRGYPAGSEIALGSSPTLDRSRPPKEAGASWGTMTRGAAERAPRLWLSSRAARRVRARPIDVRTRRGLLVRCRCGIPWSRYKTGPLPCRAPPRHPPPR